MENTNIEQIYQQKIEDRNKKFEILQKAYYKLGCPKEWEWLPNLKDCSYYVGVSDRSRGKTTNILLLILLANKYFGWVGIYFRSHLDEVKVSKMQKLCQVINAYGYVQKIFGEQWDKIIYKKLTREFVLFNSENKVESETLIRVFIVDNWQDYTGDNEMNANIFFYDEFINEYRTDTAIHFFYIHKTLARERHDIFNIMVGNTIDKNNKWFDELGLRPVLKRIKRGENKLVRLEKGTIIRFELFDEIKEEKLKLTRRITNLLYYGFANSKMSVITGEGNDWSVNTYPPIYYFDDDVVVDNHIKILYNMQYYSLTFVYNKVLGLHINIKPFNDTPKPTDKIIIDTVPLKQNEYYGFYLFNIEPFFTLNKVFYSDNFTGNDIHAFIDNLE